MPASRAASSRAHLSPFTVWVIEFGMIACVLVVPYALVMGGFRGIPLGWRFIDCSFGVFGILPLWLCRRQIQHLAKLQKTC